MSDAESLYEILVGEVEILAAAQQMEIGMALQAGTEWKALPANVRELFERVSKEFLD